MIQDSGTRREFETGAVRDIAEGKGRCDLLPLDVVSDVCDDRLLRRIDAYIKTGDNMYINTVIKSFSEQAFGDIYTAILEVSKHFEEGCKKYGPNNWRKGIPAHCYVDSSLRHYLKFLRGDKDERHDRAFLWNLLCLLWTVRNVPEMNDLYFARGSWDEKVLEKVSGWRACFWNSCRKGR